jgi:predicted small lipoprotein YifL
MQTLLRSASASLAVLALILLSGCGHKNATQLTPAQAAAFDQASPEVKRMWNEASEASRTNGYVTAYNLYYELVNADLSPEQKEAVAKANTSLNERLLAAVNKGDPAAQQAIQEMRQHPSSRKRAE